MATPPSPMAKSRVRVRVSASLSRILLSLSIFSSFVSPSSPAKISYADHCNSVVPESTPDGYFLDSYSSIKNSNGYFYGGGDLLHQNPSPSSGLPTPQSCRFRVRSLQRTRSPGVIHVEGTLTLLGEGSRVGNWSFRRSSRRIPNRRKRVSFDLSGFWSDSSGKICMVGSGFSRSKEGVSLDLSAVFKFNYPKTSTISTSLVNGTLETLDSDHGSNHFDPISILMYVQSDYKYTMVPQTRDSCSRLKIEENSIGFHYSSSCSYLQSYLRGPFKLENTSDCSVRNCGPFSKDHGFSPNFLTFNQIECLEDGRLHMYIGFSNTSYFGYDSVAPPEHSLVSEGLWDQKGSRLCLLACRILNAKNSPSIGDCSIGISLWFPSILSLKNRSTTVGRIWSNKDEKDSTYFSMVSLRNLVDNFDMAPGLKYKYTAMDEVRKSCAKSSVPNSGKRKYPDGKSIRDLVFDMNVENPNGNSTWVSATLLSIGETFYANVYTMNSSIPDPQEMNYRLWNVSYKIRSARPYALSDVIEPVEIDAEGTYDSGTGVLCMVGCRYLSSSLLGKQARSVDSMDCGILVNIQLAPLNPEGGERLTGKISSTRATSDDHYFEPLEVSSQFLYAAQAQESIWRMDVEVTIVLISLTLTCIFIGLQLFHVKKFPEVLPSVSITMLAVLTLGHMIPLVLNFEALFFKSRNPSIELSSGGWLEVNEVVVRVMTMVAFLLQFRLLQLGCSARSAEDSKKGLWVAERKAIKLCLPLFLAGCLIAWFINRTRQQNQDFNFGPHRSIWEVLMACAGLILDGFLLPQIILNVFWNSKDKSLSSFFYVGTTVVRAMPHLYDAFRVRHYFDYLDASYIYASPERNFYSTAWDIVIPCQGLVFAVVICLQQRFGGGWILPSIFRKTGGYETVPEIAL